MCDCVCVWAVVVVVVVVAVSMSVFMFVVHVDACFVFKSVIVFVGLCLRCVHVCV